MAAKQNINEVIGVKYGRITIIKESMQRMHGKTTVECICDCGVNMLATLASLKKGNTKSCGCFKIDFPGHTKHGLRRHPLFTLWSNIKQRCSNSNSPKFKYYGGRGIKVCENWEKDFNAFFDWAIKNNWVQGLELDRIDNNGGYNPENCRFASHKSNMNNIRKNNIITYNGISKTVSEWADITGIPKGRLSQRINKLKMPIELVLSKEKIKRRFKKKI